MSKPTVEQRNEFLGHISSDQFTPEFVSKVFGEMPEIDTKEGFQEAIDKFKNQLLLNSKIETDSDRYLKGLSPVAKTEAPQVDTKTAGALQDFERVPVKSDKLLDSLKKSVKR